MQTVAQRIARGIGRAGRAIGLAIFRTWCWLLNFRRRMLRSRWADYAVIVMDHAISERAPSVPWWYAYVPGLKLPLSLEYLSDALRKAAVDPDLKGIVFLMKGPGLSLAQAQSLAGLFDRFRRWDHAVRPAGAPAKELVVHLEQTGIASYAVACAADRVSMTPMTTWEVLGVSAAPTYWQETLSRAGLEFDVVKIAPWKTAFDQFSRTGMSDAEHEQFDWLFDSLGEDIVGAIVKGRALDVETVRDLIDRAPLTAEQTQAAGLVDAIFYEDELSAWLGTAEKPAALKPFAQIRGLLFRRSDRRSEGRIGVLNLQGAIVLGESRSFPLEFPLLGRHVLGSLTAEQQIRAARRDSSLQAVVAYVDSGGGSSLASDLIWRELDLLAQEKPLIVYMGNVAASGGYYIAAPGHKIVAQSATLTGSIGVVTAKMVTAGTLRKLGANREVVQRGNNASIYTDTATWSEDQRQTIEAGVRHVYQTFKSRVAAGRKLAYEELDAICNGRVWTGRQAQSHGLVDELGDFQTALDLACQAAELPTDCRVALKVVGPPRSRLFAQPANPAALLFSTHLGFAGLGRLLESIGTFVKITCLLGGSSVYPAPFQGLIEEQRTPSIHSGQDLWYGDRYWLLAGPLPRI